MSYTTVAVESQAAVLLSLSHGDVLKAFKEVLGIREQVGTGAWIGAQICVARYAWACACLYTDPSRVHEYESMFFFQEWHGQEWQRCMLN